MGKQTKNYRACNDVSCKACREEFGEVKRNGFYLYERKEGLRGVLKATGRIYEVAGCDMNMTITGLTMNEAKVIIEALEELKERS